MTSAYWRHNPQNLAFTLQFSSPNLNTIGGPSQQKETSSCGCLAMLLSRPISLPDVLTSVKLVNEALVG